MAFIRNRLFESSIITKELMSLLLEENRFEKIELSMPDMITCYLHGTNCYKKNIEHNTSIIDCIFITYSDKIIFSAMYRKGKDCKLIEKRLNNELPYLKESINVNSDKLCSLIMLEVFNKDDFDYLSRIGNLSLKYQFFKQKIDIFFETYANEIISKIIEILVGIRV